MRKKIIITFTLLLFLFCIVNSIFVGLNEKSNNLIVEKNIDIVKIACDIPLAH